MPTFAVLAGCCARAANGHTAARSVMKSRRWIWIVIRPTDLMMSAQWWDDSTL